MTVRELIEALERLNPEAVVSAVDVYGEGRYPIKGLVFNEQVVDLTGEETS